MSNVFLDRVNKFRKMFRLPELVRSPKRYVNILIVLFDADKILAYFYQTYDKKACKLLQDDDYDPGENYYSNKFIIYNEFMRDNCYSLYFYYKYY